MADPVEPTPSLAPRGSLNPKTPVRSEASTYYNSLFYDLRRRNEIYADSSLRRMVGHSISKTRGTEERERNIDTIYTYTETHTLNDSGRRRHVCDCEVWIERERKSKGREMRKGKEMGHLDRVKLGAFIRRPRALIQWPFWFCSSSTLVPC